MSRLFRAGVVPALGLSLILLGPLAGCGGDSAEPGDGGAGEALPPAEPGQTAIPDTGTGATATGDEGGATDIPVDESPAEPGTGS